MHRFPLHLLPSRTDGDAVRRGEPITVGVPLPRGLAAAPEHFGLESETGRPLALQTQILDRWADGSARWALLDFQADARAGSAGLCQLLVGARDERCVPGAPSVAVSRTAAAVVVDTGTARFVFDPEGAFPLSRVTVAGIDVIPPRGVSLLVERDDGTAGSLESAAFSVESSGPLRATVAWTGHVRGPDGRRWLDLRLVAHCFAGMASTKWSLTLRNPQRAVHAGNFWELGDPGSILLREVALVVAPGAEAGVPLRVDCSFERSDPLEPVGAPFELYQESSGGAAWQSPVHLNRDRRLPLTRPGYEARRAAGMRQGLRASPIVAMSAGGLRLAATMEYFWENFPKAFEVGDGTLRIGLFPRRFPDLHELQGGEQKTHELALAFDVDPVGDVPLAWCRSPTIARLSPDAYRDADAWGYLVPTHTGAAADHDALLGSAIDGDDTFLDKRERIDEYGWRNFGDIYADHETAYHPGAGLRASHYNNQYDAIAGFAIQFFRSGDVRWWLMMRELAAHVIDIDVYHTEADRPAYSGGLFWHTYHYVDAGTSTHRCYARAPGVPGGGPSNEHNYNAGLMLHYFLTGATVSRDTAVGLARWVVQIDDGRRAPLRLLDAGPTGLASSTFQPDYHGPGRGAGNSIAALLTGYRLTGSRAFRDKAEELIRRCVHPLDDVDALGLTHAESRWSYTVFFQVLGRYLDECVEAGHLGPMYAWARASLVRYARWMVEHERPYLETPDELEYPTETWAAQDLRKSDVLMYAVRHAPDEERPRLVTRARFFYRQALEQLRARPTHRFARPVVILLSSGWLSPCHDVTPTAAAPAPSAVESFPPKRPFVPRRRRVVRRLILLAGIEAVLLAAVIWLLIS